jgi:hypothetical protein
MTPDKIRYPARPLAAGGQQVTSDQIRALAVAIHDGTDPATWPALVGATSLSDRPADRALQWLRGAGVIWFDHSARRWRPS